MSCQYNWNSKWDDSIKEQKEKYSKIDKEKINKKKSKFITNNDQDEINKETKSDIKKIDENKIDDIVAQATEYYIQEFDLKSKKKIKEIKDNFKEYIMQINDNFNDIESIELENEINDDIDPKAIRILLIITRITYQEIINSNIKKTESRYFEFRPSGRSDRDDYNNWSRLVDNFVLSPSERRQKYRNHRY
ncbi:8039_t:CDS:1 [Scutellospora calospora]|uniref:8039_t:CDS:1 n=1 Tax=Scutellospora calospora TaxID=85575 RepID=A0ACA9KG23_9GLOM|nr:8039_t:CDS:1 [Scutellospora calospora]